jgi:hypothetical protein
MSRIISAMNQTQSTALPEATLKDALALAQGMARDQLALWVAIGRTIQAQALAQEAAWDVLELTPGRGALTTMLASEAVLAKDWNKPEEDTAWANWQDYVLSDTAAP